MQKQKLRAKSKRALKRTFKRRHKLEIQSGGNPKRNMVSTTSKQPKIKDLFQIMDVASKSSSFLGSSPPPLITSINKPCSLLEWKEDDCLSLETEAPLGDRGENKDNTKSNLKGDLDLVAKICLLTAQAASLISDHLLEANKKIEALKSPMGNYSISLN